MNRFKACYDYTNTMGWEWMSADQATPQSHEFGRDYYYFRQDTQLINGEKPTALSTCPYLVQYVIPMFYMNGPVRIYCKFCSILLRHFSIQNKNFQVQSKKKHKRMGWRDRSQYKEYKR